MKKYWSRRICDAVPYVPGEQPTDRKYIKLNTNENPYPPSPAVLKAIRSAVNGDLRLYPDPECTALRKAIALKMGLKPEQVFCSNGSDEVLAFAFQAFFDPDKEIVFPRVSYSFYPVYADYFGLSWRTVPMEDSFTVSVDGLCGGNGGVILCNPNAPTGMALGLDAVERVLKENPDAVVVVDEAYVDFGGHSAVGLVDLYPNLLVIQTASKSRSLAGLRVGWALGSIELINALRCVRDSINSYTVDRIAMAAAVAAIEDEDYFRSICEQVMRTRDCTAVALKEMGFTVLDSKANFLFVHHPGKPAGFLYSSLRDKGILVRWWNDERIKDWLRITIGTDEEMKSLLKSLKQII